jgi:membrane protein implicated in regulation of membrane protease activity
MFFDDLPWLLVNIPRDRTRDFGIALCLAFVGIAVICLLMGRMVGAVLAIVPFAIIILIYGLLYYVALNKVDPMNSSHGSEALVGRIAVARTVLDPHGHVLINGELWQATSSSRVTKDAEVKIQEVVGLTLKVQPAQEFSKRVKRN